MLPDDSSFLTHHCRSLGGGREFQLNFGRTKSSGGSKDHGGCLRKVGYEMRTDQLLNVYSGGLDLMNHRVGSLNLNLKFTTIFIWPPQP